MSRHTAIISLTLFFLAFLPLFGQKVERLPNPVNTEAYDEVAPVLSADGTQLFFSRLGAPDMNRTLISGGQDLAKELNPIEWEKRLKVIYSQLAGQNIEYPIRSVYNQDIWVAQLEGNSIGSIEHPAYPLNSALPNGVLSYWDSENELILINQFFEDGSMNNGLSRYTLDKKNELPEPLYIYDFYTYSHDVQASISSDGEVLILALQREDALGDQDLYISFRTGEDIWSEPQHLGKVLNTPFRESTPYLSKDKKRLFFASDRPGGEGGMDIYVAERIGKDWKHWKSPKQLGTPINSPSNESQPCFNQDGTYLYFSSTREGSSDIFRYPLKIQSTIEQKQCVLKIYLRDKKTNTLVGGTVYYSFENGDGVKYRLNASKGTCLLSLEDDRPISLFAEADQYQKLEKQLYPTQWDEGDTILLDLLLFPEGKKEKHPSVQTITETTLPFQIPAYKKALVKESEKITESFILQRLQFKPQSAQLLKNSTAPLVDLCKKLRMDTSLTVIIEGHTDNGTRLKGNSAAEIQKRDQALLELSEQRAESVKRFMIAEGIGADRIRTLGMGSQHPLNDNSNEMERRMNRRVEIIICERGK